ncbi:MAG: hypothetical protein V1900_00235 [Candidatus Aenigmatarchaeota archaeon]
MPIVGLNIKSITAKMTKLDEKKDDKTSVRKINTKITPEVVNVESFDKKLADIPNFNTDNIIKIIFKFEISYELKTDEKKGEKIGEIVFNGDFLYQTNDTKNVLNRWKKEKKLENNITAEIYDRIFRTFLSNAVGIANYFMLPPPIEFPKFEFKDSDEYIG